MDPLFEIGIAPAAKGSRDAAGALLRQLKAAIVDGRLRAGAQLPPTRRSAVFFGVSRNTAIEVYEKLAQEGYLVTRHGSGTFVADKVPAPPIARERSNDEGAPDSRLNTFWIRPNVTSAMGFWRDASSIESSSNRRPIDFRPALVDSRLFPFDVLRRVMSKQLRGLERKPASYRSPQGNQGNFHLREAISRHIAMTRAVVCSLDDIVVTSGAQQAFDLIARVLVTPGKTVVAIEDPGYPPMRVAFEAAGANVVPVPVDDEGLSVDDLPSDVSIICVCPSHQFPLGITMTSERRKTLVDFARRNGAVIVEDDYDGEFRFDKSPLEALRTADAADVVFYVGTFSKCMLPALRLGFIVAPEWAMRTLIAAKNCLDWHCSTPLQMGVAKFIGEGHLTHHVRKMRAIYKQRQRALLKRLQNDFGEWLDPIPSSYGMHLAAISKSSVDLERIAESLSAHSVKIHGFDRYHLGTRKRDGLIFGYGVADVADIDRGLSALRAALTK